MQFNDLAAQYQHLKQEIDAGIAAVLESTHFIPVSYTHLTLPTTERV